MTKRWKNLTDQEKKFITDQLQDMSREELYEQLLGEMEENNSDVSGWLDIDETNKEDQFNSFGYDPTGPEAGAGFRECTENEVDTRPYDSDYTDPLMPMGENGNQRID